MIKNVVKVNHERSVEAMFDGCSDMLVCADACRCNFLLARDICEVLLEMVVEDLTSRDISQSRYSFSIAK